MSQWLEQIDAGLGVNAPALEQYGVTKLGGAHRAQKPKKNSDQRAKQDVAARLLAPRSAGQRNGWCGSVAAARVRARE